MTAATYEHLTIVGSGAFIANIRAALGLLRHLPSWKYIQGLKWIKESPSGRMYSCERTRTCFIPAESVQTSVNNNGADYVACQVVHEGAHCVDQRKCRSRADLHAAEVFAFTAQLEALREMGAKSNLTDYVEAALRNPLGHYAPGAVEALTGGGRRLFAAVLLFSVVFSGAAAAYIWMIFRLIGQ